MLCICLDAFKPEYLKYAKYLKSLAKDNLHGELDTVLGFTGISATFFTGCYPNTHKVFCMFDYSQNSSFKRINNFSFLGKNSLTILINLYRYVKNQKVFFKLPNSSLDKIQYFDTCMSRAWAQQDCLPITNLFDVLRRSDRSFVSIDWPNMISNKKSSIFFSHSKEHIFNLTKNVDADFCFTHFFDLDYIAHEFGTKSQQVKNSVKTLDEILEQLDTKDMLFFSDHGMVDVVEEIDIFSKIEGLNLEFGKDFVYFLDSSLARFWFFNKKAKTQVIEALEELKNGHILSQREINEVFMLPKNCCDLIFLADPGILISPNFFQGNKKVKAMHGYDPVHTDQKAFYLIKGIGGKKNAKMVDMLPTMLNLMNLPKIDCDGKTIIGAVV